ncbi:hypothetical protein KQH82_06255 [bacterium]|nr:hypothetical protein [bacterium]
MTKKLVLGIAALLLIAGFAVDADAGYYYKEITFVNTSSRVLYVYAMQDYDWNDVWYCGNLYYQGKLYPGESVTYYIDQGEAAWFTFHTSFGCCNSWTRFWSTYIDTQVEPYDDFIYIW